jgi:hypothetical protein
MPNISTFLSDKLLDHAMGSTSYTMPTVYLGLYTTNPTMPAGTGGTEVSGGSYARVALAGDWAAASAESKATNADVTFATATADWGAITGVGIFDASSAGNVLAAGPLTVTKTVLNGDTFKISSGSLTVGLT